MSSNPVSRKTIVTIFGLALLAGAIPAKASNSPTEVKAFFREGQTFLTWKEAAVNGASYRVYRHTAPITAGNLDKARMIAEVPARSSRFREMWTADGKGTLTHRRAQSDAVMGRIIPRLVIQPVEEGGKAEMLPEDTGVLVWTVRRPLPPITTMP